eukprot:Gb_04065 [translate_table: standard]
MTIASLMENPIVCVLVVIFAEWSRVYDELEMRMVYYLVVMHLLCGLANEWSQFGLCLELWCGLEFQHILEGRSLRTFRGHSGPVTTLANRLLGDCGAPILASGGADGTVRLWALSSSDTRGRTSLKATLHGHEQSVKDLVIAEYDIICPCATTFKSDFKMFPPNANDDYDGHHYHGVQRNDSNDSHDSLFFLFSVFPSVNQPVA